MNAITDKLHSCVEEMHKLALRDFSLNLAITELKIFKERQTWRDECKMTAYFQSTPEKAAFSRLKRRCRALFARKSCPPVAPGWFAR